LTTDKFLEAFSRFISVCGRPAVIYSDNGSNFIGASNVLGQEEKAHERLLLDEEMCVRFATQEGFEWKFNPPNAPHHGGLVEAAVKSAKQRLYAVTKGTELTFEEYGTLFFRIAAVLNSRPVAYRNTVGQGTIIITPAHFLIGRPMTEIPQMDNENVNLSIGHNLQLLREKFFNFWKLWRIDYLAQLQYRNKWQKKKENIKVGQIVIIKDKDDPKPFDWPLGKIIEVYPGKDGLVRVVDVLFNGTIKRRDITKLICLPIHIEPSSSTGAAC